MSHVTYHFRFVIVHFFVGQVNSSHRTGGIKDALMKRNEKTKKKKGIEEFGFEKQEKVYESKKEQ